MENKTPKYSFENVIGIILNITIIGLIILLINYLSSVLIPFVIATILAYIINPMVVFIQTKLRVKKRTYAAIISLIIVFSTFIFSGIFLGKYVNKEIKNFSNTISKLSENEDFKTKIRALFPEKLAQQVEDFFNSKDFQQYIHSADFQNTLTEGIQKVTPEVFSAFSGLMSFIFGLTVIAIVLIYLIFILIDFEDFSKNWKNFIPNQYKVFITDLGNEFGFAMKKYFQAQGLIALILAVLFSIAFVIVGLPLAIVFGLFTGLCLFIPYMQLITIPPALFLCFMLSIETGQSFITLTLIVLAIYLIMQGIQDFILTPKIMGDATGMNPAMMILSLAIWGKTLGLLGLLIALPLTSVVISYYKKYVLK